jgi:hypothetical protein
MSEELDTILRLVADGRLSPEEAAPIIEALTDRASGRPHAGHAPGDAERHEHEGIHRGGQGRGSGRGRRVRIQVSERGRTAVDLRVPLSFAAVAAAAIPGIPDSYAALIAQAVESDTTGTIVDAEDEDGDRVLITLE